ncbi:PhzF family phenazine biosynthesis protein [Streptomyces sp. SAI-229]
MTMNAPRPEVLRYTAFSSSPDGGNPAGVVLDAAALDDGDMLAIAAGLGYSESAFLTAPPKDLDGPRGRTYGIRYFSPKAEVPFCGHATVAAAVALAERTGPGKLVFATRAGTVPVEVTEEGGTVRATLTSVEPHVEEIADAGLAEALAALGWPAADLDPAFPPRIAFAGRPSSRSRGGHARPPRGSLVRLRAPRSPHAPLGPDHRPVGVAGVGHRLPRP